MAGFYFNRVKEIVVCGLVFGHWAHTLVSHDPETGIEEWDCKCGSYRWEFVTGTRKVYDEGFRSRNP